MLTFMYHDVVPESRYYLSGFQSPDADLYKVSSDIFRRHMQLLAGIGPEGLTLTFDDGGVGALHAADILDEFKRSGYFFVTTDRIGTPGFLDKRQIRALHSRGHHVGSHSCSHPRVMSNCDPAALKREWEESVRCLQDIVSAPVIAASVPGGYYSKRVAETASNSGIRLLFNSEPVTSVHVVRKCTIHGRFTVQQRTTDEWIAAVASGRNITRLRSYLFWNLKKVGKSIGGSGWLEARRFILARLHSRVAGQRARSAQVGR